MKANSDSYFKVEINKMVPLALFLLSVYGSGDWLVGITVLASASVKMAASGDLFHHSCARRH